MSLVRHPHAHADTHPTLSTHLHRLQLPLSLPPVQSQCWDHQARGLWAFPLPQKQVNDGDRRIEVGAYSSLRHRLWDPHSTAMPEVMLHRAGEGTSAGREETYRAQSSTGEGSFPSF